VCRVRGIYAVKGYEMNFSTPSSPGRRKMFCFKHGLRNLCDLWRGVRQLNLGKVFVTQGKVVKCTQKTDEVNEGMTAWLGNQNRIQNFRCQVIEKILRLNMHSNIL
jgi:hypothetical protein